MLVPPLDLPLDPPLVGLQLLSPQTAEWHLLKAIATHFVVEAVFKYQALKRGTSTKLSSRSCGEIESVKFQVQKTSEYLRMAQEQSISYSVLHQWGLFGVGITPKAVSSLTCDWLTQHSQSLLWSTYSYSPWQTPYIKD